MTTQYRIPEMAKQYTEYDMIRLHTELPDFPDYRTRVLHSFLDSNRMIAPFVELYAYVTALVQMALDTHDLVPESNKGSGKGEERARQLKVLAGDYFSSRFYYLLSKAGQVDIIKRLSVAICEVNRLKMNFYTKMRQVKLTGEDYIRESVAIRTQLYLSFSHLIEDNHAHVWPEILEGFTRCEVLLEEIERSESEQRFQFSWAFWHIMQKGTLDEQTQLLDLETDNGNQRSLLEKYGVIQRLFDLLDEQVRLLRASIERLGSDKLANDLLQIGQPFLQMMNQPKVLEEI